MKRWMLVLVGSFGALALTAAEAAAVPNTVSFTGRITQGGNPVPDGTVNLGFELFTAVTGGTSTGWSEIHNNVPVSRGLAYVALGSQMGLTAAEFNGSDVYLELTVNGEVQSPRIPINSTPYAIRAATADTLGTLAPGDVALSSHTHNYASTTHTHTDYALSAHTHNYASTTHTHTDYALSAHTHNYASTTHTHSDYALTAHTHNYAATSHTHNYASTSHTHTQGLLGRANLAGGCDSVNPSTAYVKLLDFGTYSKQSASSALHITWQGNCKASSMAGTGVRWELRVDGVAASGQAGRQVIRSGNATAATNGLPCGGSAVFTGLAAGSRLISMYVQGVNNSASGVQIDPGCYSMASATVLELQ